MTPARYVIVSTASGTQVCLSLHRNGSLRVETDQQDLQALLTRSKTLASEDFQPSLRLRDLADILRNSAYGHSKRAESADALYEFLKSTKDVKRAHVGSNPDAQEESLTLEVSMLNGTSHVICLGNTASFQQLKDQLAEAFGVHHVRQQLGQAGKVLMGRDYDSLTSLGVQSGPLCLTVSANPWSWADTKGNLSSTWVPWSEFESIFAHKDKPFSPDVFLGKTGSGVVAIHCNMNFPRSAQAVLQFLRGEGGHTPVIPHIRPSSEKEFSEETVQKRFQVNAAGEPFKIDITTAAELLVTDARGSTLPPGDMSVGRRIYDWNPVYPLTVEATWRHSVGWQDVPWRDINQLQVMEPLELCSFVGASDFDQDSNYVFYIASQDDLNDDPEDYFDDDGSDGELELDKIFVIIRTDEETGTLAFVYKRYDRLCDPYGA
eukprot:TRINITY_DN22916_c0_g1_i1.p1 TRINITY_DN22916_c0_g1~~TRINITY_DN22916_c0_g1_i1.p1  ORF type:complete len:433 (+),score=65.91 TRINITY_DN22916_c0_g1_i1:47-1345(+)